jgi:SAM-dependent methyltransferase
VWDGGLVGSSRQVKSLSKEACDERDFRNREAEHYYSYIPAYQYLAEWSMYDLLLQPGGSIVLDLGVGTGRFAAQVVTRFDRLVGIDFALAALLLARKRSPSNCRFVVADVLQLPLRPDCVDAVFSSQVLEHILDIDDARRFCRPGAASGRALWSHVRPQLARQAAGTQGRPREPAPKCPLVPERAALFLHGRRAASLLPPGLCHLLPVLCRNPAAVVRPADACQMGSMAEPSAGPLGGSHGSLRRQG